MWFGDLVTMTWFDDVWMKEVFANFLAAKIVNPSFPDVNHALRFFLQNYPAAYDVDRTAGANPIRQDLANLYDAGSLYGAIIYQKAPIVMRQLEMLVGAETFRARPPRLPDAHAFGNAEVAGPGRDCSIRARRRDLKAWSQAWVAGRGRPTISTELQRDGGVIGRLSLHRPIRAGAGCVWPQRLQVAVGRDGATARRRAHRRRGHDGAGRAGCRAAGWVLPDRRRTRLRRLRPRAGDARVPLDSAATDSPIR